MKMFIQNQQSVTKQYHVKCTLTGHGLSPMGKNYLSAPRAIFKYHYVTSIYLLKYKIPSIMITKTFTFA